MNLRILMFVVLLWCLVFPSTASTCEFWRFVKQAPWMPTGWPPSAGFDTIGNTLYMFGGDPDTVSYTSNATWKSIDGIAWQLVNMTGEVPARQANSFATFQNKLWVVGGIDFATHADVWNSTDGNFWYLANASAFPPRQRPGITEFKGKLWVMGGYDSDSSAWYNDTWWSDDGIIWHLSNTSAAWPARDDFNLISTGSRLWIVDGAYDYSGPFPGIYNDSWYSDDGDLWYLGTDAPPYPKKYEDMVVFFDNKLWKTGGTNIDTGLSDTNILYSSTDGITWDIVNSSPEYPQVSYSSLVAFNGKLFLYTGRTNINNNNRFTNFIYECCDGTCPSEAITCRSPDVTAEAQVDIQGIVEVGVFAAIGVSLILIIIGIMGAGRE